MVVKQAMVLPVAAQSVVDLRLGFGQARSKFMTGDGGEGPRRWCGRSSFLGGAQRSDHADAGVRRSVGSVR